MDAREKKFVKAVGKRIRQLRTDAGHTNRGDFAYENDIDRTQMGRLENGADMKLSSLHKVISALGISIQEFFSEGFD